MPYLQVSRYSLIFAAMLAAASAARAQTAGAPPATDSAAPSAATEFQRQQARERQLREQVAPTPDVRLEAPPKVSNGPLTFPQEAPCFAIRAVRIEGLPPEASDGWPWLLYGLPQQGQWQAEPRCLGIQGVQRVLDSVQNALVARGFVTSRALTAPQDLSRGELVLTLIPGRVQRIVLADEANARVSLRNALPLREGDLLNLRDIEQALENLKRPPTADADIQIAPGTAPGQSELHIKWRQSSLLRVNASVDDSGSKGTGKLQGSLTLSCDNCLGVSDLAYVSVNHDLDSLLGRDDPDRGTRALSAYAAVPWGYQLFSISGSSNRYHQSVAGASQTYLYSGTSNQVEASTSRLVYRDARHKLTLAAKAFRRHSDNAIDDTEIEVQRRTVAGWGASINHSANWGDASLETTLAYRRGTGAFGAIAAPEETFGEGTSRFQVLSVESTGKLPFTWQQQRWIYNATWRWQGNRTPLVPQDRFAIGGRYTVRGFDGELQLGAEHGWLLRQEMAWVAPDQGWPAAIGLRQVYLGLDHGHVGGPSSAQLLGQDLTGGVLGLRLQKAGFSADLFGGSPLRKPQGFRASGLVAGFSFSYGF